MRTYTESEVARVIATIVVKSRTDERCKGLAAGAKHVAKLLGVDNAEVERMTTDLLACRKKPVAV